MTGKQIFSLLFVALISGVMLTATGVYLWHFKPELLGLPPSPEQIQQKQDEALLQKQLNDSLQKQILFVQDSLKTALAKAHELQEKDRIAKAALEAVNKEKEVAKDLAVKKDSLRLKNMKDFAEMYDKADPAEVAKILSQTDTDYTASVLKMMKRKSAAKVIEKLPTKKAAEVSTLVMK